MRCLFMRTKWTNKESGATVAPCVQMPKGVIEQILEQGKASDLLALYTFYTHTAQWQDCAVAFATQSYVCKALGLTVMRMKRAKAKLRKMNLIETIRRKGGDGKINGVYVKINHFQKTSSSTLGLQPEGNMTRKCLVKKDNTRSRERGEHMSFLKFKFPKQFDGSNEFKQMWSQWFEYRETNNFPNTPKARDKSLGMITKNVNDDPHIGAQIIQQSIDKKWQGLFPLKDMEDATKGELIKGISAMILEVFEEISEFKPDKNKANSIARGLDQYFKKRPDNVREYFIGGVEQFVEYYCRFIYSSYENFTGMKMGMMGVDTKSWEKFIYWMEHEQFNMDFENGELVC